MDILTTLPTDSFVTAAFAELLEDVGNLLKAARESKPLDKEEVAFWQRQLNALNKAESYFLAGVRPQLAPNAYLLASASRPGALVHRLFKAGGIVVCSCEAGQKQTLCWHHMLVNVLERAAELESLGVIEAEISGGDPTPNPQLPTPNSQGSNPIPHAAAASAWVGGHIALSQRLAATAQLLDTMRAAQGRRTTPAPRDEPRRLGVRLASARKRSAYFTSALYLEAA